jgi:hypothetical protein
VWCAATTTEAHEWAGISPRAIVSSGATQGADIKQTLRSLVSMMNDREPDGTESVAVMSRGPPDGCVTAGAPKGTRTIAEAHRDSCDGRVCGLAFDRRAAF